MKTNNKNIIIVLIILLFVAAGFYFNPPAHTETKAVQTIEQIDTSDYFLPIEPLDTLG